MGNNQSRTQQVKVVVVEPTTTANVQQVRVVPVATQITNANVVPKVERVEVVQRPFSLKSTIQCMTQSLMGIGPWIHRQRVQFANSQLARTWRNTRYNLRTQVKQPLCNLYNTIPQKMTQAKFQLIDPYTYNQRFAVLNILCALTAIGTITSAAKINPGSRLLRATRNVGFMYLFGGLLLAPEIYNPFIRSY